VVVVDYAHEDDMVAKNPKVVIKGDKDHEVEEEMEDGGEGYIFFDFIWQTR